MEHSERVVARPGPVIELVARTKAVWGSTGYAESQVREAIAGQAAQAVVVRHGDDGTVEGRLFVVADPATLHVALIPEGGLGNG